MTGPTLSPRNVRSCCPPVDRTRRRPNPPELYSEMRAADIEPLARALLLDLGVPDDVIRAYSEAVERGKASDP